MGTRRRIVTLALVVLAIGALAAAAGAEVVQSGGLRVNFSADITPKTLPRERPAPVTVEVEGKISTADAGHPPPLSRLRLELNSAGQIDSQGLPTCPAGALQSTSSEEALAVCRPAQVGSGHFEAQLQLTREPIRVTGQALVFNSIVDRHPGMLIHIYIAAPVQLTLVIPLKISRGTGKYGTVLTTVVPKLAGGSASITELRLRIGRRYSYQGSPHSYLSASCAAPAGFPGASFTLARGSFTFVGGQTLHATLTRNCKVRSTGRSG